MVSLRSDFEAITFVYRARNFFRRSIDRLNRLLNLYYLKMENVSYMADVGQQAFVGILIYCQSNR